MVLEANLGSPIKSSTCNIPVSTTAKLVKMDLDYLSSSSYEPPTYSHSFQILSPLYLPHVLSPMYTGFFFSFAPLTRFQLSLSIHKQSLVRSEVMKRKICIVQRAPFSWKFQRKALFCRANIYILLFSSPPRTLQ